MGGCDRKTLVIKAYEIVSVVEIKEEPFRCSCGWALSTKIRGTYCSAASLTTSTGFLHRRRTLLETLPIMASAIIPWPWAPITTRS